MTVCENTHLEEVPPMPDFDTSAAREVELLQPLAGIDDGEQPCTCKRGYDTES